MAKSWGECHPAPHLPVGLGGGERMWMETRLERVNQNLHGHLLNAEEGLDLCMCLGVETAW